ncbi:hypothetical protein [Hyphococcus sp.]|jgi:hypothetical protein|uniref:hypothetical protein n=1 Tax=Hyphococcus sp. TaxID=2038636 RepID=UPI003D13E764
MRVDIDRQDILNALADTRKTFDRAKAGLVISLSLTAGIFLAAAFGAWRGAAAIMAEAPALSLEGLRFAYSMDPDAFFGMAASLGMASLSFFTGLAILAARRKRAAARKEEALSHPLNAGRLEFIFSAEKLTIMGPLSVKKISWQNIAKMESRKSSIVFHRKDGGFEFIPKNVVPNENFFDLMTVKHGPLLNKPCSYEEAHLAKPLSITYEASRGDLDDYYAQYFKKRDGKFHTLRRLAQWRPLAPFLFLVAAAFAGMFGYTAFNTYSLLHAGAAMGCALAAGAIFVMNGSYFRGPAHPFRKNEGWPYAQTDLVTVSLSKDGVSHARHGATDVIRWGAFSAYMESRLFGYLVVAPKHVIALPKRAFLNKAHFDDFTAFAKRSMTLAKQQKSDAERGRLVRSFGQKEAQAAQPKPKQASRQAPAATTAQPQRAKPALPKPAPQSQFARIAGPSPKAAPAQVKAEPKPAPKTVQQLNPAQAKQAQARPTQQAIPATQQPPKTPAQKLAKKPATKPASDTVAILNSALKKAAQLEAKARQQGAAAPVEQSPPPKKKSAAE